MSQGNAESAQNRESASTKRLEKVDKTEVKIKVQGFVKDRLKSPSSADFCWRTNDSVVVLGENKYRVVGCVDAQNSFGAMLRSDYVCEIAYLGGNWLDDSSWRVISLVID